MIYFFVIAWNLMVSVNNTFLCSSAVLLQDQQDHASSGTSLALGPRNRKQNKEFITINRPPLLTSNTIPCDLAYVRKAALRNLIWYWTVP